MTGTNNPATFDKLNSTKAVTTRALVSKLSLGHKYGKRMPKVRLNSPCCNLLENLWSLGGLISTFLKTKDAAQHMQHPLSHHYWIFSN
jgi:hypothetical protein